MCLIYTENNYTETEWKGKHIEYGNNFTENTVIIFWILVKVNVKISEKFRPMIFMTNNIINIPQNKLYITLY